MVVVVVVVSCSLQTLLQTLPHSPVRRSTATAWGSTVVSITLALW
jgi:hypothetical protein